ncbi:MAG: HD domain-containing protein [Chloroflexi bacterium]|nr:HD domain-containing protein [Chloroflexota bacterium]
MLAQGEDALEGSPGSVHVPLTPSILVGILLIPLVIIVSLRLVPSWDLHLEAHWFHFQVVSFTSLVALVVALLVTSLAGPLLDIRTFFITLAFTAIAGIFLIHGLATPGVMSSPLPATSSPADTSHSMPGMQAPPPSTDGYSSPSDSYGSSATGAATAAPANPAPTAPDPWALRSGLAVTWSAPLSLFAGGLFFCLASLPWTKRRRKWILAQRSRLWRLAVLGYIAYIGTIIFFPQPLMWLSQLSPTSLRSLASLTLVLYLSAAFSFWRRFQDTRRPFEAAMFIAAGFLAEAVLCMVANPLWNISWWSYHVLMLLAFMLAMGAVVLEYERVRHFQLSNYFAATSVVAVALLAGVAGELATNLLGPLVAPENAGAVRWGTSAIFLGMSGLLFLILWQVVYRWDQIITERTTTIRRQETALERSRMAQALVPIGLAIGATLDLDQVLDIICEQSLRLFNIDSAFLWLREGDELVGRAARGHKREQFIGMRRKISTYNFLGARILQDGAPLLVNHAQHSVMVNPELCKIFDVQAILGVPFLSDNHTIGALILSDTHNPERFVPVDMEVATLFGQQATVALTHARLYDRVQQQAGTLTSTLYELQSSYQSTLMALSAALDARDRETEGHSQRVAMYTLLLTEALEPAVPGIKDQEMQEAIEWGALLHDVGKIGVPDAILHKPGKLTEAEWQAMRRHPPIGYEILQDIAFLKRALPMVLHHHERWDGTGYPRQLRGEAIPLIARIFAVADTLDAITSKRPYREARSFAEARAEILRHRGSQFDPTVVDAFMRIPLSSWGALAGQSYAASKPLARV